MSMRFLREMLMAVTVLSTATANGAEIVLEQSAVQKLVVESLFKGNGRCYIQRGACSAYLENPAVTLTSGPVVIRSHLNARLGMDFGDSAPVLTWRPGPRSPANRARKEQPSAWQTFASRMSATRTRESS